MLKNRRGIPLIIDTDPGVDADRLPGQTFFEEDPAGGFFTLEIRDGDALKKAMLDCLFPEKRKS